MSGLRFWYHAATGKQIPVESGDDPCLPLFDEPVLFGLHDEMFDEARNLEKEEADRRLVSLAVANGWTLIDGAHDRKAPAVVAPSEETARIAARQLRSQRRLSVLRVETLEAGLSAGRGSVVLQGWTVEWFLEGTPLHALQKRE